VLSNSLQRGPGAFGGVTFEPGSIVINSSGTSATELSRDMLDAIEREMARRVNFGIRGEGWTMIRLTNALGAEKVLPLTMSFKRVPLEIDVPSQPLYGLDGEVRTGKPTLRARQFALEGRIYYPDKERIRQELDSILFVLMHPPIEVYRYHTHDRFLRAYALGAPQDWESTWVQSYSLGSQWSLMTRTGMGKRWRL